MSILQKLALLLLLLHIVLSEKFVATSEWAEIQEGQSVPKGLHVRMDLSTGVKEAKLMGEEDEGDTHNQMVLREDNDIRLDSMEEGLKNVVDSKDTADTVSGRFRTMEELKQYMPNVEFKTEGQVLRDIMDKLTDTLPVPSLIILLEELEDLAHKYDNGKLLLSRDWMKKIAGLLYHDNEEVYKGALRVISAASQSNPSVQAHFINEGYLGTLISKVLSQSDQMAKSTIFAISSMIRNLPSGQEVFQNLSGYNTLTTKLALSHFAPLQRTVLSLYNDLIQQDSQQIVESIAEAGRLICTKTSTLILETQDTDVFHESVRLYSHLKKHCTENTSAVLQKLRDFIASNTSDVELLDVIKNILV